MAASQTELQETNRAVTANESKQAENRADVRENSKCTQQHRDKRAMYLECAAVYPRRNSYHHRLSLSLKFLGYLHDCVCEFLTTFTILLAQTPKPMRKQVAQSSE